MKQKNKGSAEFTKWFGPLILALQELGGSGKPKEVSQLIAIKEKLSDSILEEKLESGAYRFHNQVQWARQYLVWEGLIESAKHGVWALTAIGKQKPFINEIEANSIFHKWVGIHQKARKEKGKSKEEFKIIEEEIITENSSPETTDLLEILQSLPSGGFEQICGRLLRESGFENVVVTGRSHDGGFDGYGILEINPFVSMKVLFQCKRYKGSVSRAEVGDFRNAMLGRAEKGIIITTGSFSKEAEKEANRDGVPKIELVDGEKLVEMFQNVELGVVPRTIYEVDIKFFEPYFTK